MFGKKILLLAAVAQSSEFWKHVGVVLIGVLLGADLAILGFVAKHIEDINVLIIDIRLEQRDMLGRLRALEAQAKKEAR